MKRFVAIICCFLLVFTICLPINAKADALTASMIGATAFGLMSDWGISFTAGHASSGGMNNWMTSQVESYVNHQGGSLLSVFGNQIAMDATSKLVVGYQTYNAIKDFVDWMKDAYDLSSVDFTLSDGTYSGREMDKSYTDGKDETEIPPTGMGMIFSDFVEGDYYGHYEGYKTAAIYNGGARLDAPVPNDRVATGSYYFAHQNNVVYVYYQLYRISTLQYYYYQKAVATVYTLDDSLSWNGSDYVEPVVLNPTQEWVGDFGAPPDTNLDQLMGGIYEDIADNNLQVEGEIKPIDPPQPSPTPAPIDPDMPLQDVPWEGLDNNLQQLYEQGLEEIGTIGDARDAITDAVADQTGTLEGAISDNAGIVSGAIDQAVSDVQTAIGTQTGAIDQALADNAGVVSGAIDQAVSDVQTAISEQTAALDESLSATAEGVETIAEAIEDEAINWRKFDLRGLFPFCIPFDIYNMLNALDASPVAPHVQLPFVIQSIGFSYNLDLDFSAFDSVAAIMRQMELICYGLALAWATSKVIKW